MDNSNFLLDLILVTMGKRDALSRVPSAEEWEEVKELATRQGLLGFLQEGLDKLPLRQRPPKMVMLQWIGEVLSGYEYRYELYYRTIAELAGFFNEHGIKMMVLKGYACSLDWPKPEHRPSGDIDIWLFGRQKEADALVSFEKGIEVDNSHHHHTVFMWRDFMVENHYDFINVHHRKLGPKLEEVFKELGGDDSHTVTLFGETIYLPSPNLHALFLLRHSMQHFVGAELTLRQLMDWGFFVEKHGHEVDWEWLAGVLEEFGMTPAFNIFNAICVEDLGFPLRIFPTVQYNPIMKDRVLEDILAPAFPSVSPRPFLQRIIYKYRRWRGNAWKQQLCYKESPWSAFWTGLWAKILKPKSI